MKTYREYYFDIFFWKNGNLMLGLEVLGRSVRLYVPGGFLSIGFHKLDSEPFNWNTIQQRYKSFLHHVRPSCEQDKTEVA